MDVKYSLQTNNSDQDKKKDFICEVCSKNFARKGTLKQHIKSVHKEVKYDCKDCGKQFSNSAGLISHVDSVHRKIKYDCPNCIKQLSVKSYLSNHIKMGVPCVRAIFFHVNLCNKVSSVETASS